MSKHDASNLQEILTVEELAAYLKVTPRSIYNLVSRHEIPAFRVGGSWRFRRDEIEALTKSRDAKKGKAKK